MTVKRFDSGGVVKSVERTPEGWLRLRARATRVGVFLYRREDGGLRRELRLPEEVFKPDSLKTIRAIPVTNDHPATLITRNDAKEFMVGTTGSDVFPSDDKYVDIDVNLFDGQTIDAVEAGKQEVSCGYVCDMDETPGVWNGETYDVIQRNIVYNHVAVVQKGRAGPEVRLRLDAADAVMVSDAVESKQGDPRMKVTITLGGKDYVVEGEQAESLKAAVQAHADTLGDVRKRADTAETKVQELGVELDKQKARADGFEEKAKERTDSASPEKINALVKERVSILNVAHSVMDSEELKKLDDSDNMAVLRAVVEKKGVKLDGKSDEYARARFDFMVEELEASDASRSVVGKMVATERAKEPTNPVAKARLDAQKRASEQWKPKKA